ncbi:XRE family transcriptional regulator [Brevundimonas naejangsanensis]|uniref:XRE family transcriptional regulator n=1 Tax=Brevundimonas naejangsanensis TaxID=588932 RepID=A0A494RKN4_9CAUL|nr:helix-turn-helix transcriptional regulator [Brevundimonas naejangsanensis]AYG94512.1 XRE family transcriptional regulator [Brevundimonas naejangsanensis]
MPAEIDLHLGRRLRRRRRLLGLTQQQLGDRVGIRFQQIQKYECGANRISAARLWELAEALQTPVSYFYDGAGEGPVVAPVEGVEAGLSGALKGEETLDLIRTYSRLGEHPRRRLLDLARSLAEAA